MAKIFWVKNWVINCQFLITELHAHICLGKIYFLVRLRRINKKIKQSSTLCSRCMKSRISCQALSTKAYFSKQTAFVDKLFTFTPHLHFDTLFITIIFTYRKQNQNMPTGMKRHCGKANNNTSKPCHNLQFWHWIHEGARSVGVETIGHLFSVYISKFRPWI